MPVFTKDERNILYIHVPKTGGSTIEGLMRANGFEQSFVRTKHSALFKVLLSSPQHYHAQMLEAVLDVARFDYIFMTVRHPLNRLISEYRMRTEAREDPPNPNQWMRRALEQATKNPFHLDNHMRPQAQFRVEGADVFRQEDGFDAAWVETLSARMGMTLEPHLEDRLVSSARAPLKLGPRTRAEVARFYGADYAAFGYEP